MNDTNKQLLEQYVKTIDEHLLSFTQDKPELQGMLWSIRSWQAVKG